MLRDTFNSDSHGRRYADVVNDPNIPWNATISFFESEQIVRDMITFQTEGDLPPLYGVVRRLEKVPEIASYLGGTDAHITQRYRQAVGVLIRIIMESNGFRVSARSPGPLGTRKKIPASSNAPGAYENESGVSRWFVSSKYYEPVGLST